MLLNFEHSLYRPPAVALLSLTTWSPQAESDAQTLTGSHIPHTPPHLFKDVLPNLSFISDLTHNYSALASGQAVCSVLFCIISCFNYLMYSL